MKNNLSFNITLFFMLLLMSCATSETVSPSPVSLKETATQPSTIEAGSVTETPTATAESKLPTTVPEEPTPDPTLEPTPEPTEEIELGDAGQEGDSAEEESKQGSGNETDPGLKPDCEEKAAFYGDVSIPDDTQFRQDEVFTKIWRVRNEGTCTWGAEYNLVFAGGAQMNGAAASPLPQAGPGDIIEIPLELTAPLRGGTHVGNWMFSDPYGEWFGVGATGKGEIWVRILVNYISPDKSGSGETETTTCGAQRNTASENEALALINNARSSNGLVALSLNQNLSAAALTHSSDMACNDFVDHSGSDGSSWYDRISNEGYIYTTAKENIYVGDPAFGGTPAGAFEWWMNSQIHRENILSDDITEIGIAYVYNEHSTYGGYYTTVFARP